MIIQDLCDGVQINCPGIDIPNTDFELKLYRRGGTNARVVSVSSPKGIIVVPITKEWEW